MELADLHRYYQELELFQFGAVMSNAYHTPKNLQKINPNKLTIDLEKIHPMLRPTRTPSG